METLTTEPNQKPVPFKSKRLNADLVINQQPAHKSSERYKKKPSLINPKFSSELISQKYSNV